MEKIMDESLLEVKAEILMEIYNLIPEEEKQKEVNKNGFEIKFEMFKEKYKISYLQKENKIEARLFIPKGKKIEELEKLDTLFIYKQALIDELNRKGKKEIVAHQILRDCRHRVKEKSMLNLLKLDAETEIK